MLAYTIPSLFTVQTCGLTSLEPVKEMMLQTSRLHQEFPDWYQSGTVVHKLIRVVSVSSIGYGLEPVWRECELSRISLERNAAFDMVLALIT